MQKYAPRTGERVPDTSVERGPGRWTLLLLFCLPAPEVKADGSLFEKQLYGVLLPEGPIGGEGR